MRVANIITAKLEKAFSPEHLEVIDNSEKHLGHAGYREGGESHWKVVIVSKVFEGKSRLQRQRLVNAVLSAELQGPIHALEMDLKTVGE